MEKRTWKIMTICFITTGLLFIGMGVANPIKDDITYKILRLVSPSEIGDVDLNAGRSISVSLLDLNSADLDQLQDDFDSYAKIGQYPGACLAQGVINSRDTLLGIKVLLKTFGTAQNILFCGVMTSLGNPTSSSSYDRLGGLPPGFWPSSWTWMELDFSDDPLDVDAGQEFWIVLFSTENVEDDTYRGWGASSQAPYPSALKTYDFNTNAWNTVDGVDMCFATYTESPPPPPPPPPDVYLGAAVTCRWIDGWQNYGPMVTEFELGERVNCYLEWQPTSHDFYGDTIGYKWHYNGIIIYEDDYLITEHWYGVWWAIWYDNLPVGLGYVTAYWNNNYLGSSNSFEVYDPSPPPPPSPDPPIIDITFSWSVIMGALGGFNILGGIVSFAKFRMI